MLSGFPGPSQHHKESLFKHWDRHPILTRQSMGGLAMGYGLPLRTTGMSEAKGGKPAEFCERKGLQQGEGRSENSRMSPLTIYQEIGRLPIRMAPLMSWSFSLSHLYFSALLSLSLSLSLSFVEALASVLSQSRRIHFLDALGSHLGSL